MTNDAKDLKPCPFCGNKMIVVNPSDGFYFKITCVDCSTTMTAKNPLKAWNSRATPQQPSEPLKELECKHEWVEQNLSDWCKLCGKIRPYAINTNPFNKPSEKKALSRDGITDIIRIDLRDKMKKGKLGLVGYTRTELAEELSQAIHSALPARKEVKWPEKMDEERFYCEDGDIYRGREWNECRDACIAAYEEAIPAHQYIEYLKSENESLRKFPPCGTAQREVRYPEKEYCGKINTALHNDNCEECKYHKLRNKLIDKMKKLNGG